MRIFVLLSAKQWIGLAMIWFAGVLHAQTPDEKLVAEFVANEEFEKALPIAASIFKSNTKNVQYYEWLLQCQVQTSRYNDARETVRKMKKNHKNELGYEVDELWLKLREQPSNTDYENWVDKLVVEEDVFRKALQGLEKRGMNAAIVRLLERADFVFEKNEFFAKKLTDYYMRVGNRQKALSRFVLSFNSPFVSKEYIKYFVDMNVTDSLDYVLFRDVLIAELQKDPNNMLMNTYVNWCFVQLGDWKMAYLFNRGLDKRLGGLGDKLMNLAEVCMENREYKTAERCYADVLLSNAGEGTKSQASMGKIACTYEEMLVKMDTTGIMNLMLQAQQAYAQIGGGVAKIRLAELLGNIYIKNSELGLADKLWQDFVDNEKADALSMAKAKMAWAQVLTLLDDMWTSELLYAQVEKDFGENPLGQEAKFKRAQLSYYRGDFEWSNVQLNVLKQATTQTIANNAIELSLIITENLGLDSNYDAMEKFAMAQLYTEQGYYAEAIELLDSISLLYVGNSLADNVLFQKALIAQKLGDYTKAAEYFELVSKAFSHDVLADDALFNLGLLYYNVMHQEEKAQQVFEKLLVDMPGSLYAIEARKYYRKLRGDKV